MYCTIRPSQETSQAPLVTLISPFENDRWLQLTRIIANILGRRGTSTALTKDRWTGTRCLPSRHSWTSFCPKLIHPGAMCPMQQSPWAVHCPYVFYWSWSWTIYPWARCMPNLTTASCDNFIKYFTAVNVGSPCLTFLPLKVFEKQKKNEVNIWIDW